MPASSKHKYSKILAFPDTYYELIINLLQSVELFCAYYLRNTSFLQSAINIKIAVITNIIPIGSNVTYCKI